MEVTRVRAACSFEKLKLYDRCDLLVGSHFFWLGFGDVCRVFNSCFGISDLEVVYRLPPWQWCQIIDDASPDFSR